jgi:hypothetical protein
MCVKYCSDIGMEGVFIRDCREIVRMEVMCKLGIIYYSVCGEYGGGSGSEGKGKGREERKESGREERRKEK